MEPLQELYNEYSFLPSEASVESKTEDRVSTNWEHIGKRTYEKPLSWYLVVFSPINKAYTRDREFFQIKGLDKCRQLFKRPTEYLMTRELVDCEKTHVNAVVCTDQDVLLRNNSIYCNKYHVHVQCLPLPCDRDKAITYITKESSSRTFTKYLDYLVYQKKH